MIDRIASRWLLSRASAATMLEVSLREYEKGNPKPTHAALDAALAEIGVSERQRELGSTWSIQADWFYALGRQHVAKVRDIVSEILDLRKWVGPDLMTSVDSRLVDLVKDLRWLETKIRDDEDTRQHGPFTIVRMPGVSRKDEEGALQALDSVTKALSHKFPQVLYGKVFITPRLNHGMASYVADSDVVYLSMKARNAMGDDHALIHEFGHRFFHKFWKDRDAAREFQRLSTELEYEVVHIDSETKKAWTEELVNQARARRTNQPVPRTQDARLMAWIGQLQRDNSINLSELRKLTLAAVKGGPLQDKALQLGLLSMIPSEYETNKVVSEPLSVTHYGATSWTENFAEAFAHFVLGKPLPGPLQKIMEGL